MMTYVFEKDIFKIEAIQARNAPNVFKLDLYKSGIYLHSRIVTMDEAILKLQGKENALGFAAKTALEEAISMGLHNDTIRTDT